MIRLEIQQTDNVIDVINKIKKITDLNIELIIPEESVILENGLNLKLIQYEADKVEKSVEFVTQDEIGNALIASLTGKSAEAYIPEDMNDYQHSLETEKRENIFQKIHIPKIKLPSFISARRGIVFPAIIILAVISSFIFYGSTAPRAIAKIKISSQPLARSVTVRVKADTSTDVQNKILKGTILTTNIEVGAEKDTTGTKTVGEKAEGEIKIYNKTSSEIKLEKGDRVTYEGKSTDLKYTLKGDVDVPPSSPSDPLDPASPLIPGEASVDIIATDIGESYNIDDGKSLRFSDYEKSELEGKTKEDIAGGKSEEVKIVTQEDIDALVSTVTGEAVQKAEESIKSKLGSTQKLISGSTEIETISDNFSAKVGDDAAKISLNKSVSAKALIYFENDLNSFIDKYVEDVVPENFVLSSQDKEIKAEVLGKSTNSVLSSAEADIQVTLKAFVVPDIKEEEVKNRLKGKTYKEAQEVIGSIKNVNSYEFSITPAVPFFKKTPSNIERIDVILVRE